MTEDRTESLPVLSSSAKLRFFFEGFGFGNGMIGGSAAVSNAVLASAC